MTEVTGPLMAPLVGALRRRGVDASEGTIAIHGDGIRMQLVWEAFCDVAKHPVEGL